MLYFAIKLSNTRPMKELGKPSQSMVKHRNPGITLRWPWVSFLLQNSRGRWKFDGHQKEQGGDSFPEETPIQSKLGIVEMETGHEYTLIVGKP